MGRENGDNGSYSRQDDGGDRGGYRSNGDEGYSKFHQDAYKQPEIKVQPSFNPSNQVENNFHPTISPVANAKSDASAVSAAQAAANANNKTEVANTSTNTNNLTNGQSLDSSIKNSSQNQNQNQNKTGDVNVGGNNSTYSSSTTIKNFAAPALGAQAYVQAQCGENTYGGITTIFGGAQAGHADISTECMDQMRVQKLCDKELQESQMAINAVLASGTVEKGSVQEKALLNIANNAGQKAMRAEEACYQPVSEDSELKLPPVVIQHDSTVPAAGGNADVVTHQELNDKLNGFHRTMMQK